MSDERHDFASFGIRGIIHDSNVLLWRAIACAFDGYTEKTSEPICSTDTSMGAAARL